MEIFINSEACLDLFYKSASKNHKVKVLMLLTKYRQFDITLSDISPEMRASHAR
jgi:hypothetical protein